ncbi:MAG: AAA family ATPase [Anaerolineae bacterium]
MQRRMFPPARPQPSGREPLAARMRPQSLDDFVGQEEILGPERLLRRAIESDQVSSIILWGPPGTGKTSLAMIIANATKSHFTSLSAVTSGVADIRRVVEEAKRRLGMMGERTILLVDEIHRFNKAQQDALLPHVEDGTIVLIGATTENPYFEVIGPLVSRSRVFQLQPLSEEHLLQIMRRALADKERGLGRIPLQVDEEALRHIAHMAGGDARVALNALESAATTTSADRQGMVHITLNIAEQAMQRRAILYDKDGDAHYDTISAFIKSMRGSDPDAALYWLAKMIYAGEDPRFIVRRMIIFASEDVGLADPQALMVAVAAAQALEWVGLPEAQYNLAEAAIYLATAPKSNSAGGYFKALADVEREGDIAVPRHLQDATRDGAALGHGEGYQYPHNFPGHWVRQQYLPRGMEGRTYYEPGQLGYEKTVAERMAGYRKAGNVEKGK